MATTFTWRFLLCPVCMGPFRLLRSSIQNDFGTSFEPMALLVHTNLDPITPTERFTCDTCGANAPIKDDEPRHQVNEDGVVQSTSVKRFIMVEADTLPEPQVEHVYRRHDSPKGHQPSGRCWCDPWPEITSARPRQLRVMHNDRAGVALGFMPRSFWEPPIEVPA